MFSMFSFRSLGLLLFSLLLLAMPCKTPAAPLVSGPTITYDLAYSGTGSNLTASGAGSFTVNFMDEAGQTVSGSVTAFTFELLFSGTGVPHGSSAFSYGLGDLNSDVVVADGSAANPSLEYFALSSSDKPAQFVLAYPASDPSSTYPAPYTSSGAVVLTTPPSTVPEPSTLGLTAGMGILLVIAGLLRRRAAAVETSREALPPVRFSRVVLPGLFVLALLFVPRMRADTVSYSAAFGLDNTQTPMYAPYSQAVSLPQFNSALGQLTGVQLGFSNVDHFTAPEIDGETSIAGQTVNYSNVTVNQRITLTASDGTQLTNTLTEGPATGSVFEATAQDFTLYPTFTSSQADSGGAVPNTDFGAFEGPGNLSLTAAAAVPSVSGTVSFSPNPPLGATGASIGILGEIPTNEVFGDASITYTYTPSTTTPEPATAALLLLALPAVCLLKKARCLVPAARARGLCLFFVFGLTLSFCAPEVFAGAVNIVQNPGFEEGYTAWYFGNPTSSIGAGDAHSGNSFVELFTEVEQGLVTNPGATYSLSFWAANFGGGQMSIYWNGDLVQSVSDPGGCHVANCTPLVWNEFSYSDLLATSALTPLELTGSFVGLDDFTVVQTSPAPATAAPEPPSLIALALGLSICLVAWWRRCFRPMPYSFRSTRRVRRWTVPVTLPCGRGSVRAFADIGEPQIPQHCPMPGNYMTLGASACVAKVLQGLA